MSLMGDMFAGQRGIARGVCNVLRYKLAGVRPLVLPAVPGTLSVFTVSVPVLSSSNGSWSDPPKGSFEFALSSLVMMSCSIILSHSPVQPTNNGTL
jgi:hypothetical protein